MSTRLWLAVLCGYLALGATIQALPARGRRRPGHGRPARDARGRGDGDRAPVRRPPRRSRPGGRPSRVAGAALVRRGRARPPRRGAASADWRSARLTIGAGEGALFTGALARVLADAAPAERRGRLIGHFGLSMWGGLAAGPPLAALAAAQAAARSALWLAAAAGRRRSRADRRRTAQVAARRPRRVGGHAAPARAARRVAAADRDAAPRLPHPLTRPSDRASLPAAARARRRSSAWRPSATGPSTRSRCCRPARRRWRCSPRRSSPSGSRAAAGRRPRAAHA